jgi:hypothetical protein
MRTTTRPSGSTRISPNSDRGRSKRAKGDSAGGDADIAKAKQLNPSLSIAAFSGAATAQTLDQQRSSAPDPDLSISGCTPMFQSLALATVSKAAAVKGSGVIRVELDGLGVVRLSPCSR